MEAVCEGKRWDVALAFDSRGEVSAALPYLYGSRWGLRYVLQPQLTQYNGPWYRPDADRQDAARQLQRHLDGLRLALFHQNAAPQLGALPEWDGYEQSSRVTYRIEDISDPQRVFEAFDKSRRQRQIRRAEKVLTVNEDVTPEQFARFHAAYWQRRGEKDLLSQEFIIRIIRHTLRRGQGILLGLDDSQGSLQAARFVAYDGNCAYSLLSALGDGHPNGASPLLFWEILKRLSGRCASFDFEGSMDPGIALSYSLYGARPTTYLQLTRCRIPLLRRFLHI